MHCSGLPLSISIKHLGLEVLLHVDLCSALCSSSGVFKDVSCIRSLQMTLSDVAYRSVLCQSVGTNTRSALCQHIVSKRLVNSHFPQLGKDFNGLLSRIPSMWVEMASFHTALLSTAQTTCQWARGGTADSLFCMAAPNLMRLLNLASDCCFQWTLLMAPNRSHRSPASIKWKGGFLPSTWQVPAGSL